MIPGQDLFALLLRLAGRIPDEELAFMRTCLADGEADEIAGMLVTAAGTGQIALTEDESRLIRALAAEHGIATDEVDRAPRLGEAPRHRFISPDKSTVEPDVVDEAVIQAAGRVGGLRGMWCARRVSGKGAVRVHLGEAAPDADVVELTAEIQHALTAAGHDPRVEVFPEGAELPHYHDSALADAALVWTASPPAAVNLARVFDGADSEGNPFFRQDHPCVGGGERDRLLTYLRAGEIVLSTAGLLDDVVDPARTDAVEVNFRSDGAWIWNDAVTYYLDRYGLVPGPDLVTHVRAAAGAPRSLSRLSRHQVFHALSVTTSQQRAGQQR